MTFEQILPVAVVLMLGVAVQAAVGFGAGLFSVPLLVWLRVPLPVAVGLVLTLVIVQTGFNCWQHRTELPWRSVLPVFLLRGASLPVGVALMYAVTQLDVARTKQVIGMVLLIILSLQTWCTVRPKQQIHWVWTVLAGSLSGVMAGMLGMGGPPLVLWLMAHDWPSVRQRIFLWLSFLLLVPFQAVLLMLAFGKPLMIALLLGFALTPAGLAAAWIGGQIGRRLSRPRLRMAMTLVLLGIAIQSIVGPLLRADNRKGDDTAGPAERTTPAEYSAPAMRAAQRMAGIVEADPG